MQELCAPLREAATTSTPVECSDGYERDIVPIVAAWLGDREEHELIASIVKVQYNTLLIIAYFCIWLIETYFVPWILLTFCVTTSGSQTVRLVRSQKTSWTATSRSTHATKVGLLGRCTMPRC